MLRALLMPWVFAKDAQPNPLEATSIHIDAPRPSFYAATKRSKNPIGIETSYNILNVIFSSKQAAHNMGFDPYGCMEFPDANPEEHQETVRLAQLLLSDYTKRVTVSGNYAAQFAQGGFTLLEPKHINCIVDQLAPHLAQKDVVQLKTAYEQFYNFASKTDNKLGIDAMRAEVERIEQKSMQIDYLSAAVNGFFRTFLWNYARPYLHKNYQIDIDGIANSLFFHSIKFMLSIALTFSRKRAFFEFIILFILQPSTVLVVEKLGLNKKLSEILVTHLSTAILLWRDSVSFTSVTCLATASTFGSVAADMLIRLLPSLANTQSSSTNTERVNTASARSQPENTPITETAYLSCTADTPQRNEELRPLRGAAPGR